MLITNNTQGDYWFGPMHLLAGVGQTLTLDDTSDTSLYLIDDVVADAVNTLYLADMIGVTAASSPFPRPTGVPSLLRLSGSPEALVYAPQGSLCTRRDDPYGATTLFVKTTGVTLNSGWVSLTGAQRASYNAVVTSPAGTASAAQVMLGLGGAITPIASGNVLIVISGVWQNASGAGNQMTVGLYTGPGSPPANGAALTGTQRSALPAMTSVLASTTTVAGIRTGFATVSAVETTVSTVAALSTWGSSTASALLPFQLQATVTGLALDTPYWFDLAFNSSSGTNTISYVTVSAAEV